MADHSYLDQKYFIDDKTYNCPFCNRHNVVYTIVDAFQFDWGESKKCYGFITKCSSCQKTSMHLTWDRIVDLSYLYLLLAGENKYNIDSYIFYSVPTSFFVLDERIPKEIRELITEAEGCMKMNFLTGASACMRKAIYELLVLERCDEDSYDNKIKSLKTKYKDIDESLFDILAHIKDMTSDKVHEQSWDKWDSGKLKLIIETLKEVLHEMYVIPAEKKERQIKIMQLRETVSKKDKSN